MTRCLLLSGGPTHHFDTTSPMLAALLAEQGIDTTVVTEPADMIEALRGDAVDLLAVNALRWRMPQERYAPLRAEYAVALDSAELAVVDRFVRGGGGLLALHTAVICFDADPTWHALCGASWRWEHSSHPPFGPVAVTVTDAGRHHDLTRGVDDFVVDDEAYGFLDEVDDLEPLLVSTHGGRAHPLLWARPVGRGRVVTDLLGHGPDSFEHPTHRRILTRAAAWTTGAVDTPAATRTGSA